MEEFVMRFAPTDSKIVHKIIQTSNWLSNHNAIIVFYEHPDTRFNKNQPPEGEKLVTGLLFVQNSSQQYNRYLIGDYEIGGVTAEINSVFFEKVGNAREKDLFVMVSWTTRNNAVYSTYIYESPALDSKTDKLVYLEDLSKQFFSIKSERYGVQA